MRVPIARPWIPPASSAEAAAVLASGWLTSGPQVEALEAEWRQAFCPDLEVAAVNSCTTGLFAALRGLEPRDKRPTVAVPAFTWVATANAAIEAGFCVELVDIDLGTFNIVASANVGGAEVVVPVHLFGRPAPVTFEAAPHAMVLEDAACAFGATHQDGRPLGTGTMGAVFSLHPRKAITCGEGGMVQGRAAAQVRRYRNHGETAPPDTTHPSAFAHYDEPGLNFRLPDVLAAVLRPQLAARAWLMAERRRIVDLYHAELGAIPWLRLPERVPGHGWQAFVALVAPDEPLEAAHALRDRAMDACVAAQVGTRPGTMCIARSAHLRGNLTPAEVARWLPNAWRADLTSLALPLWAGMSEAEVEHVVATVRRAA